MTWVGSQQQPVASAVENCPYLLDTEDELIAALRREGLRGEKGFATVEVLDGPILVLLRHAIGEVVLQS